MNEVGLTPEKCSNLKQMIGAFLTNAKEDGMSRLWAGAAPRGTTPMTPDVARLCAEERAKLGYVILYPAMKEEA